MHIPAATKISKGPPLTSNVSNEDYQNIWFTVTAHNQSESALLFQVPPVMYPNGTLELVLKQYVNDMTVYSLVLSDNGGPPGSQSLPLQFTVQITAVNNEPT